MPAAKRACTKCGKVRLARMFRTERSRVCIPCTKERSSATAHATHVESTYGITGAEYATLIKAQRGVCAGCGQPRRYRLNVDHDHKLERALIAAGFDAATAARLSVRGGLCRRCNKLLRDCRDGAELLRTLADYLAHPPAFAVIEPGNEARERALS